MLNRILHWVEVKRRRSVLKAGGTDYWRWSRGPGWSLQWSDRAAVAATFIPEGATVLDIGCADMCLEKHLPPSCTYVPCDLVKRDERTIVCDFNAEYLDLADGVTHICVLGVLEYLYRPVDFMRWLSAHGRTVVLSYCPAGVPKPLDRPAQGWVNAMTYDELSKMLAAEKLKIEKENWLSSHQILFCLTPEPVR